MEFAALNVLLHNVGHLLCYATSLIVRGILLEIKVADKVWVIQLSDS